MINIKNKKEFDLSEKRALSLQQIKFNKIFAAIVALFAINNVIYFTPGFFGVLYYGVISFFILIAIWGGGRLRINIEMWVLYAVCWLSILGNDISSVFKAEFRCICFMLVTLLLTPALSSEFLSLFRQNVLRYLLDCCIIISVLSFVGRFLGFSVYLANTGMWCGITAHSMLLGPIAGVSIITTLYKLLTEKSSKKIITHYRLFALASGIFCLIGSASRASILAALIGAFVLIIRKGSVKKIVPLIFIGLIVCITSLSFISSLWENVAQKNKNESTLNLDSRTDLWKQRLIEFKENLFWGVGFASIEDDAEGNQGDSSGGKIEPGSSWLIILSMLGVLGGVSTLLLLNNTVACLTQCKQKDLSILLFSLSVFWAVEMCAEGFVFASGSFLFFMLWSLVGAIEGATHLPEKIIEENLPEKDC